MRLVQSSAFSFVHSYSCEWLWFHWLLDWIYDILGRCTYINWYIGHSQWDLEPFSKESPKSMIWFSTSLGQSKEVPYFVIHLRVIVKQDSSMDSKRVAFLLVKLPYISTILLVLKNEIVEIIHLNKTSQNSFNLSNSNFVMTSNIS